MESSECIRVEVNGVLGLVPYSWPPGPVRIAAVLPSSVVASEIGVGDELLMVNDVKVCELDRPALARELSRRPLFLEVKRHLPHASCETIDVQVQVSDGAIGFCPRDWHSEPIVVGAVLPNQVAATKGVREGDVLVLIDGQPARSMELAAALSRRPVSLRFRRSCAGKGFPDCLEEMAGESFLAPLGPPQHSVTDAPPADVRPQLPSPASVNSAVAEAAEVPQGLGSDRRPPKPRRPTKGNSRKGPDDLGTRRPPQPDKPFRLAKEAKPEEKPREARDGGTQTDVVEAPEVETAEKGIQLDVIADPLEQLPLEEPEQEHSQLAVVQASSCHTDEAPVAAVAGTNHDLPRQLRPPAISEPHPDMPPLRPRDRRTQEHHRPAFRFFQLPPPEAPPALDDIELRQARFGAISAFRRPSELRELPPPRRPPDVPCEPVSAPLSLLSIGY